ncbi:MAG: hypothetical protein WC891_08330 [Actinomycetota bacterium]
MDATLYPGNNYLRVTLISILVACLVFFGGGWLFVKIVGATQNSRAVETEAAAAERPADLKLPEDIPLYKSGNIDSGKEVDEIQVFVIVFTLGSIEEVKDYYEIEMPARGWQAYAEGSNAKQYLKTDGKKKASMVWQYYAGKPRLRLTIREMIPEI